MFSLDIFESSLIEAARKTTFTTSSALHMGQLFWKSWLSYSCIPFSCLRYALTIFFLSSPSVTYPLYQLKTYVWDYIIASRKLPFTSGFRHSCIHWMRCFCSPGIKSFHFRLSQCRPSRLPVLTCVFTKLMVGFFLRPYDTFRSTRKGALCIYPAIQCRLTVAIFRRLGFGAVRAM